MILLTGQPKIVRLLEAESSNSGWKEGRGWREGERERSINQGVQIFRYEKRISLRELPCSIMPAVNNTVLYPKNYLRGQIPCCVLITKNNNNKEESGQKRGPDGQVCGTDCGDGFTGICSSPNPSSCIKVRYAQFSVWGRGECF